MMKPLAIAKWIVVVGGLLAAAASFVYVGILLWMDDPSDMPEVAPVVDYSQYRLAARGARSEGFVGSHACQECHAEEVAQYATHPMSKSAAFLADVPPVEDYGQNPHVPTMGNRTLSVVKENNLVRHVETLADDKGVVSEVYVPIDIEFGSGKRGRSFLTNRDGVMFMSPLTWYTTTKTWGLSPGFQPHNNLRFSRRIVDGCIQCHAGQVVRRPGYTDQLQKPYFHEIAIGCERCHGPGESHIAFRRNKNAPAGEDPIVNPVKLEPARREAVCNQCHLQGIERILQMGRSEYDFRPGDHLADVWVTFVQGTRLNEKGTMAVSQVEQMESSRCFEKSSGTFGCLSCHSAHTVPAAADLPAFYRSRCLECHAAGKTECSLPPQSAERQKANDSCIACHMPSLPTNNVPHTAATDHRIQKVPSPHVEGTDEEKKAFRVYEEGSHAISDVEVQRARGIYLARLSGQTQDPRQATEVLELLQPILAANREDVASLFAVGTAHWVLGDLREAERHWDRVLMLAPNHEQAISNLSVICQDAGVLTESLAYMDMAIEVNPWRPELYGRRAHMLGRMGRIDEGIETAKRVLQMDPGITQVHGWLAEAYDLVGKKEDAQKHRTILRRMSSAPP